MLDLKFIRENPDTIKLAMQHKGFDTAIIDELIPLDASTRKLQVEVETLRAERNKIAALGPHAADQGRKLKQQIEASTQQFDAANTKLQELIMQIPNLVSVDTPIGEGESANIILRSHGEKPDIANPEDHIILGERFDLIDSERAAKVAGSRFNYLKNQAVLIEFALIRLAMDIAQKHGFTPMITPELVNQETVTGTGYLKLNESLEDSEVYKTQDNLYLIGTSEMALVAYHQNEILPESKLPVRYVGFSSCFRREAGTYGKDTRGIIRQHQFDKVELVSLVKPQDSEAELERILSIEEEIMQTLQLPYQVVKIGSGDLGMQAYKKYDIEAWMPGQNKYRETHSCSNTTDFQTRRLNIRYKNSEGKNEFVHALNGTAVAIGRMLVALLENGQQNDGSIKLPDSLAYIAGFNTIR
jgi:seryl-tRNA synthetase